MAGNRNTDSAVPALLELYQPFMESIKKEVVCSHQREGETFIIHRMFETQKFFDLTIKCRDREWNVHKNILSYRSELFAKACGGDFKVCSSSLP